MTKKIDNQKCLPYIKLFRTIMDFPKEGIAFLDITPFVYDVEAFGAATNAFSTLIKELGATVVAGIESRGFLFAPAIATSSNLNLIPIRKEGKLPLASTAVTYDLEYGSTAIEIPDGLLKKGDRVVIVDDILATGGTLAASEKLINNSGAEVVACCTLVDLEYLEKPALPKAPIYTLFRQKENGEIY